MNEPRPTWWNRLRVQQKVWTILLAVFVPLVGVLVVQVTLINHLLTLQQERHQLVTARQQILILRRLGADIEDAFRGYLLTRQEEFLQPLVEAEPRIGATTQRAVAMVGGFPELSGDVQSASDRLKELLESKRELIGRVRAGHLAEVLDYVSSGQGLKLSDALRYDFRSLEDQVEQRLQAFDVNEATVAQRAYWGLILAVAGGLALGLLGSRWLTRSITEPIAVLQSSVVMLGKRAADEGLVPALASRSSDEIGKLAQSFEEMARRIRQQIQELEAISAIGHEINTIGPDGLAGVLRRITDRAADLLQVDVCLVMLRNEQMGCWVVEAASGEWNEKLDKTVMLWEEFPVSVQAFESRQPAFGENLRQDSRPEVLRRNLIGQSMLSIPLLSQGSPFGVLVLLREQVVSQEDWQACLRLAKGFADEAAIAIVNARLYEALYQKEKGLQSRLRELEHLAETLAHDLKAPGERMESLASLLLKEYGGALDERATKWLRLIEANGRDLTERVHNILEVAQLGTPREAIEAVDPALVLNEVLKAWAGELERRQVRVRLDPHFPMVACHRAYLRQVFDNLISNAVRFSGDRPDPMIRITAERKGERVQFSVADNGVGIPPQQRERVFEAFVRLSPSSSKGSGIGLAIVKRLVELYGGKVWIESNEPAGCTVRFTLPVLGDLSQSRASAIIETVPTEL